MLLKISLFLTNKSYQWRSQEFTSGWARDYFSTFGWAQTQKFEDLSMNLHLCKRFSEFLGGPVPTRPLFWLRYWVLSNLKIKNCNLLSQIRAKKSVYFNHCNHKFESKKNNEWFCQKLSLIVIMAENHELNSWRTSILRKRVLDEMLVG